MAPLPILGWIQATADAHLLPQSKPVGNRRNSEESRVEGVIAVGDKLHLMARFLLGDYCLLNQP
jgi:hypothetical protein